MTRHLAILATGYPGGRVQAEDSLFEVEIDTWSERFSRLIMTPKCHSLRTDCVSGPSKLLVYPEPPLQHDLREKVKEGLTHSHLIA